MSKTDAQIVQEVTGEYRHGFVSDIESETIPPGLNEDIIRTISAKKDEPEWLLSRRLQALETWQNMAEPHWLEGDFAPIDYQAVSYFSAPKKLGSMDEVDPEILKTFDKLGVPLEERAALAGVAVDAVVDSVSVKTTYQDELKKHGIIFCSISEAVQEHPELVQKYLGSVVPDTDNYFACLNAAAFTDGTFVYIPPHVRCPMELSTYFRINAEKTGQLERTLLVADKGSYVSYLEGCTAPQRDENQLHAAVVELVALEDAEIRYSTVQNWYPGDAEGKGGIYNFVTKRGVCRGARSKISWTQMETGSAVTWKYPSCVLLGKDSVGEFYSVAITNGHQQADTGTKMIHVGRGTKSRIVSKGVSAGKSSNTYRGIVDMAPGAVGARNTSQCDSLILGADAAARTYPTLRTRNPHATTEHEATTSRVSEEMLYYLQQRGMTEEQATALVVSGFSREVLQKLPMEFAIEAQALLEISLEDGIG